VARYGFAVGFAGFYLANIYTGKAMLLRYAQGGVDLTRLTRVILALYTGAAARAAEPIKIGMSMALTGPLAGTGKAAVLGTQISCGTDWS
jgi:hypothetical protein